MGFQLVHTQLAALCTLQQGHTQRDTSHAQSQTVNRESRKYHVPRVSGDTDSRAAGTMRVFPHWYPHVSSVSPSPFRLSSVCRGLSILAIAVHMALLAPSGSVPEASTSRRVLRLSEGIGDAVE